MTDTITDRPGNVEETVEVISIEEAAKRLGIKPGSVRKRWERKMLSGDMSESGQLLSVYWTEKLEAERKDDAAATVDDDAATQRETLLREIIDRQDTELTRRDEIIREQQRIISGMATSLQSVGDGLREVKALSVPAPTFRERRFLWWRWYEPVETGSGR